MTPGNPHNPHNPPVATGDVAELHVLAKDLQKLLRMSQALRLALAEFTPVGDIAMAISQALTDALAAVDKATNDVAARVTTLAGQIGTGMTQAEVDSVVAQLNTEATKLEGIAADPNQPVPPTP
jgi:hypothetical protein